MTESIYIMLLVWLLFIIYITCFQFIQFKIDGNNKNQLNEMWREIETAAVMRYSPMRLNVCTIEMHYFELKKNCSEKNRHYTKNYRFIYIYNR